MPKRSALRRSRPHLQGAGLAACSAVAAPSDQSEKAKVYEAETVVRVDLDGGSHGGGPVVVCGGSPSCDAGPTVWGFRRLSPVRKRTRLLNSAELESMTEELRELTSPETAADQVEMHLDQIETGIEESEENTETFESGEAFTAANESAESYDLLACRI
jgi:hypothetical protein